MLNHIYHYNTNGEQRFFLGSKLHPLYTLIAMNGNIVSHTPAGVAGFIANTAKPFYIDPQTHAFQHATSNLKRDVSDREKGEPPKMEFKPSIVKLAERLGTPFSSVIDNDRPLAPEAFIEGGGEPNAASIREICEKAVEFETRILLDSLDEEAKEFLDEKNQFDPALVVPPYFYLSPNRFKDWLKINIAAFEETRSIERSKPIFFPILVSQGTLAEQSTEIIEAVERVAPDGILLWIDGHTEETLSGNQVELFIKLTAGLRRFSGDVFNIHGGFLSILMGHNHLKNGLTGVGHAVNYGESRSIIPVGGGIPLAHFYFPSIHARLRFGDALGIMLAKGYLKSTESYLDNVCRCTECNELLAEKKGSADAAFYVYGESTPTRVKRRSGSVVSLEYPTKEAKQAASCHYLFNKAKEFQDVERLPFKQLVGTLRESYNELSSDVGEELVAHLNIWDSILNELI